MLGQENPLIHKDTSTDFMKAVYKETVIPNNQYNGWCLNFAYSLNRI